MKRVEGRTAVVTGGAKGMEAATVRRLAAEGANVIAADVDLATAEAVGRELGPTVVARQLDVRSTVEWAEVVREAEDRFGPVVLAWLNRSPWWGWVVLVALIGATRIWWLRGRLPLRFSAWVLTGILVAAVAVLAHPPPQNRVPGGQERQPTPAVPTGQGPVTGVYNDDRSVEIFAGIPYAAVPVQGTPTFFTRALSQLVQVPLEETFLNPCPVGEDSLTLNIWRNADAAPGPLPVLVYIAGGDFATGSGTLPLYDGEALASGVGASPSPSTTGSGAGFPLPFRAGRGVGPECVGQLRDPGPARRPRVGAGLHRRVRR